jgi:hypothetical protein
MQRSNGRLPAHDSAAEQAISADDQQDSIMPTPERPHLSPASRNGTEPLGVLAAPFRNGRLDVAPNGRPTEIARPELPVETFRVEAPHHGPCACPLCGERMQEITIAEERWSKHLIVRAEHVAAYRCDADDFEQPDLSAQIAFLSGALTRIQRTADHKVAEALRQELAAARTVEEKLQSAAPAA